MNTPTKSEVVSLLTRIRAQQASLAELFSAHEAALKSASEAQSLITQLGTPAHDDDEKISQLAGAERKLKLSNSAAAPIKNKIALVCGSEVSPLLDEGGRVAQRLLWSALAEKRNTVAAVVRPYCVSDEEAQAVASQTSAVRSWATQFDEYTRVYRQIGAGTDRAAVMGALATIEEPCAETSRAHPDFKRFFKN